MSNQNGQKNHNGDFASLSRLSELNKQNTDWLLTEMASSIMRLTATTRKGVRDHINSTAEEMSKLHPFNNHLSLESKMLLLIKEKGYTPAGDVSIPDKKMHNLFFDDARIRIEQDKLFNFMLGSEKANMGDILSTLTRLNIAETYTYGIGISQPGVWMVELKPLGMKLAEIIQKQKDAPAVPTGIVPRT